MTVNTERRNFITSVGVAAASTAVLAGTQALRRRTADVRSADPQTGAVYAVSYPGNPSEIPGFPAATPGDFASPQDAIVLGWNKYRIEVNNDIIKVALKVLTRLSTRFWIRPLCISLRHGTSTAAAILQASRPSSGCSRLRTIVTRPHSGTYERRSSERGA